MPDCKHWWRLFAIWWGSKFFECSKYQEVREADA